MTLAHVEISLPLLLIGELLYGTAMATFAIFAIWEAMHRNLISHRNWIIRSYAIAFNAASLPLLTLSISPVILIVGEAVPIIEDAIHLLGWIINLIIAEKFLCAEYLINERCYDTHNSESCGFNWVSRA